MKREYYTEEERRTLDGIAAKHGVVSSAILDLLDLELAFHSKGRRYGLTPKLREIVQAAASRDLDPGSEAGAP